MAAIVSKQTGVADSKLVNIDLGEVIQPGPNKVTKPEYISSFVVDALKKITDAEDDGLLYEPEEEVDLSEWVVVEKVSDFVIVEKNPNTPWFEK